MFLLKRMNIEYIEAKGILTKNTSPENWFGIHYNMNVYRGCQHDCIYCDSRSDCYNIYSFSDLIVKKNAVELLDTALQKMRKKVTIGTGSMSDPYIPAEKHLKITESILKIVIKYKYPFHITTKSDLIIRDLDLLNEINKTFLNVCFSLSTYDDKTALMVEPKAPSPTNRLKTLQQLSVNGIYTGVLFQPILPYMLDTEENIKETVYLVSECGGRFIIPFFAVTMRHGQREYFLEKLGHISKELKAKYETTFKSHYVCHCENSFALIKYFQAQCKKRKILYKMADIKTFKEDNNYKQMTLFDFL